MGDEIMKIIIVSDNARQQYANFLTQLISRKDDTESSIVGVKDGSVETSVWTEKHYEDNKATLPSSAIVIFIGQSPKIKKETAQIPKMFYKYGMVYGWIGSKAVLTVKDWIHSGLYTPFNYKEFTDYYDERKNELNLHSEGNELQVLNAVDQFMNRVKDTILMVEMQYKCLTTVFYLDGLSKFLGDLNGKC